MYNFAIARDVGFFPFVWRTVKRQYYKRILRRDYLMRLPTGEDIILPPNNSFTSEVILTNGNVDWGAEEIMARHLDSRGVFLDVGAHFGYYSLYMLPFVKEIHAFEPDPRTIPHLRKNFLGKPCLHVHELAVSNWTGKTRFALNAHAEMSHLENAGEEPGAVYIDVRVVSLDGIASLSEASITGIKIDVEGFDSLVLQGAQKLIHRCQPLILTEAVFNADLVQWVSAQDYGIYAAVCDRASGRREFVKLTSPESIWTKMIFLVPSRLKSSFDRLITVSPAAVATTQNG